MLTVMPASSNAYGLYKTTMGTAAGNAVFPEALAAGAAPKDAIAGLEAEGQKIASDPPMRRTSKRIRRQQGSSMHCAASQAVSSHLRLPTKSRRTSSPRSTVRRCRIFA